MTVNEIYQSGLKLLENNNIENSKFEAQSLLQKAFSLDRVGFIEKRNLSIRKVGIGDMLPRVLCCLLVKIYRKTNFRRTVAVYSR